MEEHPIQELMTTAMESIKDMIEINTIIGDPVESSDGTIILPVSKVGFGFAAGGSEFGGQKDEETSQETKLPFGGGSGGGVSISPVAFLIINKQGVKLIHLNENVHFSEKMIEKAPKAIETMQSMLQELINDKKSKK